jgi:hypothetical protein
LVEFVDFRLVAEPIFSPVLLDSSDELEVEVPLLERTLKVLKHGV